MQVSDEDIQAKCRSDEPNFKHKKYLRSKFEEAMMIEANYSCPEPNAPLLRPNKQEKVNAVPVQPPLPPNPPPPDTPPMLINLKQEIEDDEYKCGTTETLSAFNQPEDVKAASSPVPKPDQAEDKPTVTMCRNFARGTCKKGPACIFAHELILSQLPGVYTFCRNFQNSVCSFPKCKFVHATVFEKEHFYRTGFLPPHTLAHLKESTAAAPPPPPPQTEEVPAEQSAVYCNAPPPPPQIPCMQPAAVAYNPETGIEQSEPELFSMQPEPSTSGQGREWSEMDEDGGSSSPDSDESPSKKCKLCPTKELSERLLDAQIEQARRRNQERMDMIAQIDRKTKLLTNVLTMVLKTNTPTGNHAPEPQMAPDTDINNLSPNNNLRSMLTKMLMNMESGLQAETA